MKRALAPLALTAMLTLAACGDDESSSTTSAATATSAAVADTVAPDTTVSGDTTAPGDTTGPASPTMEAALLSVDDLPEGWTEVPVTDDADTEEPSSCVEAEMEAAGASIEGDEVFTAEREFSQGDLGPFLAAAIGEVGEEQAARSLDALPGAIAACNGVADPDGTVWTYEPFDAPTMGDDSFTVRMITEDETGRVEVVSAFARKGPYLMFVATIALFDPAKEDVVLQGLETMAARL